jgi:hypothetical protein
MNIKKRDNGRGKETFPSSPGIKKPTEPDSKIGDDGNRITFASAC